MRTIDLKQFDTFLREELSSCKKCVIAEKVGVHIVTVRNWCNGSRKPSSFLAQAIIDVLGYELYANRHLIRLDDFSKWCICELESKGISRHRFDKELGYKYNFVASIDSKKAISIKRIQDIIERLGYEVEIRKSVEHG